MIPSTSYAIFALFLCFIINWQYRKINKAIFVTPLTPQVLTFTVSISTVVYLFIENKISEEIFLLLFLQFLLYFSTLMIVPHIINKYSKMGNYINIRPLDIKLASTIFYICLFISSIYIILFWTLYSEGSDRIYFNRDYRILSLFNTLFSFWSISISGIIYSKYKIRKFLFFNLIIIFLLAFMGSRSLSVTGVLVFLFFYLQLNSINVRYLIYIVIVCFLSIIIPTQIMYGDALNIILNRVMMSGDIYLFSFVLGDYRELIEFYDPLKYFLHPFSSLFGIRGYEFPLGAQILSTAGIPVTGVGPQNHMTILALTFFPYSYLAIFIFTMYICLIIVFFMIINFYIFSLKKIHITLRSIIFTLIYIQIINIFVGINAFSFNIILIGLAIVIYFLFLLIKNIFNIKGVKLFTNNFDILRLFLAILVFFGHWNILTNQNIDYIFFHMETYAVDMFFVVSGFLIFWSFDNDQNKKHFYIKRFFRIFPLYVFLIILQTLFFIGFSDGKVIEIVKYFVVNIFFLNFLAPSVGSALGGLEVNAINGSLWTLKNEVIFYALVPFIFMLYKKYGVYFLWILYGLSVLYMFGVSYLGIEKLLVQFPAQLRLFIVGILLYVFFEKLNNKNIYILLCITLIFFFIFKDSSYFKYTSYPLCIGICVIYLVYFVKYIKINFDFSYSFYILHFPVIQLVLYFGINPSNPLISFIFLFVLILILSYFSEIYIEKRFVNIGKNIIKKEKNDTN